MYAVSRLTAAPVSKQNWGCQDSQKWPHNGCLVVFKTLYGLIRAEKQWVLIMSRSIGCALCSTTHHDISAQIAELSGADSRRGLPRRFLPVHIWRNATSCVSIWKPDGLVTAKLDQLDLSQLEVITRLAVLQENQSLIRNQGRLSSLVVIC